MNKDHRTYVMEVSVACYHRHHDCCPREDGSVKCECFCHSTKYSPSQIQELKKREQQLKGYGR